MESSRHSRPQTPRSLLKKHLPTLHIHILRAQPSTHSRRSFVDSYIRWVGYFREIVSCSETCDTGTYDGYVLAWRRSGGIVAAGNAGAHGGACYERRWGSDDLFEVRLPHRSLQSRGRWFEKTHCRLKSVDCDGAMKKHVGGLFGEVRVSRTYDTQFSAS